MAVSLSADRLILHEDPSSGNCYKIRLTAALVGHALERHTYDIRKGETRTPAFLAEVNANGRIPVLQVGGRFLPESNAACWYLAEIGRGDLRLIPDTAFERADMLRWMFFEQSSHEANVATLRFWRAFIGEEALSVEQRAQIPAKQAAGEAALALMDVHLARRDWFAGNMPSLADIVLFAYTHVADQGGFDITALSHVGAWIERVRALPGFVSMG